MISDFTNILCQIKKIEPDLILLDINLPQNDGFKICSQIRTFSEVPIIFITARDTSMDELQALTLGGDDYITKPYNIPILMARINSLLKRKIPANLTSECIEHKEVKLYPIEAVIRYKNHKIELTKTELKILFCLFSKKNEFVSRGEVIEYLWDNDIYIDDNTLSVNVSRIRDKLKKIQIEDFINTKRGLGYRI